MDQFTILLFKLEKDVTHWMRAVFASSLGKLAFWPLTNSSVKVKQATREAEQQLSLQDVVSLSVRPPSRVVSVAGSVAEFVVVLLVP